LYGCETWSLTLREERRLRVFENRVLRKVFRPKRDEVTGEWRKLHNDELNDLYSLTSIVRVAKSRRMRWFTRRTGICNKKLCNRNIERLRKIGGTNFILRIKEQETGLIHHEHDDDDYDEMT